MTTPAREAEADRVEIVYHYALTRIGVSTIEDAIALWQDVPQSTQAATAARWLSEAVALVMFHRSYARALALAYYRLVRALRTGKSIRVPDRDEPEVISLEMLRDEFEALVDEVAPEPAPAPAEELEAGPAPEDTPDTPDDNAPTVQPSYEDDEYDEDDEILLEEIAELEDLIERQEREAEEQAAILLDQLGIENMLKKLAELDEEQAAREADAARAEAHRQAGARQAAVAERLSMNAARGLVYDLGEYDGRVIGWVRYSQTGTPCGWCAMLLSREALYKSQRTAQNQGKNQEEAKFHDNCHCVAVPIFSMAQYRNSSLFALNREYAKLWQAGDPARGLPKRPSLSVWRSYFRQHHTNKSAAQAAA